jgi:hypothetical protein
MGNFFSLQGCLRVATAAFELGRMDIAESSAQAGLNRNPNDEELKRLAQKISAAKTSVGDIPQNIQNDERAIEATSSEKQLSLESDTEVNTVNDPLVPRARLIPGLE